MYPPFLLIVMIPLLVECIYTSVAMRQYFKDQTVANLKIIGNLMIEPVTASLLSGNIQEIDLLCKRAGKSSETRVSVIDASGTVLGDSEKDPKEMENHSGRPEIVKALGGKVAVITRFSDTIHQFMIYLAIPIVNGDKAVGVLRTSLNINAVNSQLEKIQHRIYLGMFMAALLATGSAFLFSQRVTHPLEKIREGAEHFAMGDLSYRLPVFTASETESLARTMNDMAANLDKRMLTIISQRKEIEAIFSSMSEGVIALNLREKIININHTAARMFGRQPSDLLNLNVQEAVRNPDFNRFVQLALMDEKPHEVDIFFYLGGESIFNTRCSPLINARGDRIGILIVLNDVTRIKHLENMRRDFAANVSHEIKTPLTAIKGFTETLKSGALKHPEEASRFVNIIETHTNRLIAIIEDLMNLSMIEQKASSNEITLSMTRICPVLLSAVQVCQPKADDKNIQIQCTCDESFSAQLNSPLMGQAFVNLLDNAIKYSKPESQINIDVIQKDSEIAISFQDYGIGISQEHLPRLFERFYRVDPSRNRKLGGTGLGLSIVKHIVNAHGGTITVKSKLAQGSEFVIHLYQHREL